MFSLLNTSGRKYVYLFSLCRLITIAQASAPKEALFDDAQNWRAHIICTIHKNFTNKIYEHDQNPKHQALKTIDGKTYRVFRPIHGTHHCARQAFLAVDIVDTLFNIANTQPHYFQSRQANFFAQWVKSKCETDPYFKQKIELVATFQRSGRQSEADSFKNPHLYESYIRADAQNFEAFERPFVGNALFKTNDELQIYKEALMYGLPDEGTIQAGHKDYTDLFFIRSILKASHYFDLRRLKSFDPTFIKGQLFTILFGENNFAGHNPFSGENTFVTKFWDRSGEYLDATGDKHGLQTNRNYFSNAYFLLNKKPWNLAKVLQKTRQQSVIQF